MIDSSRVAKRIAKEVGIVSMSALVVLFGLRALNYVRKRPLRPQGIQGPSQLSVGSRIELRGVELGHYPISVVLVWSWKCPYSIEDESFHADLIDEARRNNVPLYLLLQDGKQGPRYSGRAGAPAKTMKWSDLRPAAPGTPTIVAVNARAVVRRMWIGALPSETKTQVLDLLRNPSRLEEAQKAGGGPLSSVPNYNSEEIDRLRQISKVQVIDPGERGEMGRESAVRMPMLELPIRAPFELDKRQIQVIDCSNLEEPRCSYAVAVLKRLGFDVATLGAGSHYATCKFSPADEDK